MTLDVTKVTRRFGDRIFASGKALVVLSFVPLVSSVAMPVRMLGGGVPWWQPGAAGLLVLGAAALLVRLGARLYEGSLLRTERRTTLKEAFAASRGVHSRTRVVTRR